MAGLLHSNYYMWRRENLSLVIKQKRDKLSMNVLKHYMERRNDDDTPEVDFKDQQVNYCSACSGFAEIKEELSVDGDKLK